MAGSFHRRYGRELVNGFNVDVLHARAGRIIAAQRYGITDTEVLDAIENHVTGRPGMTLLEQIVFLADYTEVKDEESYMIRLGMNWTRDWLMV